MRKIVFTLSLFSLALLFFTACNNQNQPANQFTLNIHLNNLKQDVQVVMQKRANGQWVKLDSVTLKEGQGTLKGSVKSPELYYLTIKKFNAYIPVWVENSNMKVEADLKNLRHPTITGSKSQAAFDAYQDSAKRFQQEERALGQQYSQARRLKDMKKMQEIEDRYNQIEANRMDYMLGYAIKNNKSVISPYLVLSNSYMLNLNQLDSVTSRFDSTLNNNEYVVMLKDRVRTLKRVAVGQPFVDFTLNDPDGKPLSLSSIVSKNKYTLVDFWASWCMPCRAENPNVVRAYKAFHKKGFTVFGVSFDKTHDKWVEAIKKDGLTWPQVSDLKYWSSEAGKLYGVQSIPHNVLIGPDGKIVAKNLRGEALMNKLKEVLK